MTSTSAQAALPRQLIVVETPTAKTKIQVQHELGHRVAQVKIQAPPSDIIETLESQTGAFLISVQRRSYTDGVLDLLFKLSDDSTQIRVRRLKRGRAMAFILRDRARPPELDPKGFFSRVAGLLSFDRVPSAFPPEADDAPCPRVQAKQLLKGSASAYRLEDHLDRIGDSECAHYLTGQLAVLASRNGSDLKPFESWAFHFDPREPWRQSRRAFAHTVLAAGHVLARTGYFPEAEVMLTSPVFRPRSLRVYQAIALSQLALASRDHEEVEALLEPASELVPTDELNLVVAELRARTFLARGLHEESMSVIEAASERLRSFPPISGHLFLYGGDIALATEQTARAERFYRLASEARTGAAKSAALLRLGDLSARAGKLSEALKRYHSAEMGTACLRAHKKLRQQVLQSANVEETEQVLSLAERRPTCPTERHLALYMLSFLYAQTGRHHEAVPLAVEWNRLVPEDFRNDAIAHSVLQDVTLHAARSLARQGAWQQLIELYENELIDASEQHVLKAEAESLIADAMLQLGMASAAASKLKALLARGVERPIKDEAAALLAEAYLAAGDFFRASLVHRYFEAELGNSPVRWRAEQVAAEVDLAMDRPEMAHQRMVSAASMTPSGDPDFHRRWILARALMKQGQHEAAAREFDELLSAPFAPHVHDSGPLVEALSSCLRRELACARGLWPKVVAYDSGLITPRLRWQAARQQIIDEPALDDDLTRTLSSVAQSVRAKTPRPRP
ncbi:MAG: tetratricopeptide repeat protein [Myxococcota bacterium]